MRIWLKRALRTFFQAFLGYISASLMLSFGVSDTKTLATAIGGVLTAGLAAGISAVMNIKEEK